MNIPSSLISSKIGGTPEGGFDPDQGPSVAGIADDGHFAAVLARFQASMFDPSQNLQCTSA